MFETLELSLPQEAFDGPMQMAFDEVLLKEVSQPTLRIYQWSASCVSFGYFQKHAEVKADYPSHPLVRRWTGGGIVEHGCDLTFSLMIPSGHEMAKISPTLFYSKLHRAFAEILYKFSRSEILLAGDKDVLLGPSCFSAPAKDDLLMNGKKILGGAQRRSRGALLYQGSLQLHEQGEGSELFDALGSALSKHVSCVSWSESIKEKAYALAMNRYSNSDWLSRR